MKKVITIEIETDMTNAELTGWYHATGPGSTRVAQVMVMQIQEEMTEQDDD